MFSDKKGVFKAMFLAIIISLLVIGVLGWQYRLIEKQRIPKLQEEIERQKAEIEQKSAELILEKFMSVRIKGGSSQAMRYLTENAAQQIKNKEFDLTNRVENYEVLSIANLGENKFRFAVKVYYGEGEVGDLVELVALIKISDVYYIDSLEFAG